MGTQKKREMFDAEEYAQKMDEMIANLRKRTPVGQRGAFAIDLASPRSHAFAFEK